MKLMFDIDDESKIVVEDEINESGVDSVKQYKIRGIFSTIGEKNRNGRIYPKHIWENEVQRYQENITSGSINTLMEWEHPPRTVVDPMEAVAKITSLKVEGKHVMGEAVLLNNAKANQLKSLIDNGVKISVSSRGVGSVKGDMVENFKLITYDLVATPSDFNATMNGLVESYRMNEGVIEELHFGFDEHGTVIPMAESAGTFDKDQLQKAVMSRFQDILADL